jgi:hypothetical protein
MREWPTHDVANEIAGLLRVDDLSQIGLEHIQVVTYTSAQTAFLPRADGMESS